MLFTENLAPQFSNLILHPTCLNWIIMLLMNLNKISTEISELDKDYQLWVCSHMTSENLEYGAFNVLIIIILYYYFI